MLADMSYRNDTRKIDKACKTYDSRKAIVLAQCAEMEMFEKLEDGQQKAAQKRQLMKENLIALEIRRRQLKEMIKQYVQKHDCQEAEIYKQKLAELEKDKPT